MRMRKQWCLVTLACLALVGPAARADQQRGHLKDLEKQAKQARAKGDLEQVANYLCQAASLDASHYDNKCKRARADAEQKKLEFGAVLQTAKFELQHKDYAGAVRDLSKITFGPNHDEAQHLIQLANASLPGPDFEGANQELLREAWVAYKRGDFEAAATQASEVHSPTVKPGATQLLTNIKTYQNTMASADHLAQNADYKGAQEAYAFAAKINANGPGAPAQKQRDMEAKLAADIAAKSQAAAEAAKLAAKVDYAAEVKKGLADARRDEAKGDLKTALQAFNGVLMLDGRQAEALTGKQRIMAKLRSDPKVLVESLEDGIRSYYSSHFEQAAESISRYLDNQRLHNKGAAHFYLAASLLSEAVLADPHDEAHKSSLQQSADEQFALARQENYKPVESLVSPRILEEWTKTGASR